MAVNIPAAINLHTSNPTLDSLWRASIGTVNRQVKSNGNFPLTDGAANWTVANGANGGDIFNIAISPSRDVSVNTKILVWQWQFNAPNRIQVDTVTNSGVAITLYSGAGTANSRKYNVCGQELPLLFAQPGPLELVIDLNDSATADVITGAFDNTDVQAYAITFHQANIVGTSSAQVFAQRAHLFDTAKDATNIVKFTGISDFDDLINGVNGTTLATKIGTWANNKGGTYFIPIAFQIGDASTLTNFNDNGENVTSPQSQNPIDPRFRLTTQGNRVYVNLRNNAADTAIFTGAYTWGTQAPWDMDVSNLSSITIDTATFNGMGDFTVGSSVTGAATFNLGANKVIIKGANLDGSSINGDANLQGSTVTTLTDITCTGTLDFDTAGTYTISGGSISNVTGSVSGIVLNLINGATIASNGSPSNITIQNAVLVKVTAVDASGSPIQGARVYLEAGLGGDLTQGDEIINALTNASGVAENAAFNYTSDQPLQNSKVRKGTSAPFYVQGAISGTIGSAGLDLTVTMISDD